MSQEPICFEITVEKTKLSWWYVAYLYPDHAGAERVWNLVERSEVWTELSCWRIAEGDSPRWFIIALSEDREVIETASELLADAGEPFELDEDLVFRLALRRAEKLSQA